MRRQSSSGVRTVPECGVFEFELVRERDTEREKQRENVQSTAYCGVYHFDTSDVARDQAELNDESRKTELVSKEP